MVGGGTHQDRNGSSPHPHDGGEVGGLGGCGAGVRTGTGGAADPTLTTGVR